MNKIIATKIAKKLKEKIERDERLTRCGRLDMRLADYERIGDTEYRIMVEYSPERGTPTQTQMMEWVTTTFNGNLRPLVASFRSHKDLNAITAICEEVRLPLPAYKANSMLPVGAGRFASTDGSTWSMQTIGGEKVLVRERQEEMEEILESRIDRNRNGRYARVHLGMVRTAGTLNVEVGDKVIYVVPGGGMLQKHGVVSSISGDSVKIKGQSNPIPKDYIVDILEKNPAAVEKHNKFLSEFFDKYLFSGTGPGKDLTVKPGQ